MNNKYKKAFSGVRPSNEFNERIINMTEKKSNVSFKRVLVLTAAIIMLLVIASISVNAATNGEFFNKIEVYFNDVILHPDKVNTYVKENGNKVEENIYNLGEGSEFIVRQEERIDDGATYNEMEINMEITGDTDETNEITAEIEN